MCPCRYTGLFNDYLPCPGPARSHAEEKRKHTLCRYVGFDHRYIQSLHWMAKLDAPRLICGRKNTILEALCKGHPGARHVEFIRLRVSPESSKYLEITWFCYSLPHIYASSSIYQHKKEIKLVLLAMLECIRDGPTTAWSFLPISFKKQTWAESMTNAWRALHNMSLERRVTTSETNSPITISGPCWLLPGRPLVA